MNGGGRWLQWGRSATCPSTVSRRWLQWGTASVLLLLVLVAPTSAAANPLTRAEAQRRFQAGNQHYQNRQFQEALAQYKSLIDAGIEDPVLFYNAGNAYAQLGEEGEAVVMYERARRLAPRDPDIRRNLAFVRPSQAPRPFVLWRPFLYLRDAFTLNEWLLAFEVFLLWVALAAAVWFLARGEAVRTAARALLVAGIVLGLIVAAFVPWRWHVERGRRIGVVVAENVVSRHGPSATLAQHLKLAEGTRVRILGEQPGGWLAVRPVDVPPEMAERTYVAREMIEEIQVR